MDGRDLRRRERRGGERKEDEIFVRRNLRAEEKKYSEIEYMKGNEKEWSGVCWDPIGRGKEQLRSLKLHFAWCFFLCG